MISYKISDPPIDRQINISFSTLGCLTPNGNLFRINLRNNDIVHSKFHNLSIRKLGNCKKYFSISDWKEKTKTSPSMSFSSEWIFRWWLAQSNAQKTGYEFYHESNGSCLKTFYFHYKWALVLTATQEADRVDRQVTSSKSGGNSFVHYFLGISELTNQHLISHQGSY